MYTLAGDANLDGSVNFNDFSILQNHYGQSGDWSQGDFNHDGTINFNDFSALQNNYGQSVNVASPLIRSALSTRTTRSVGSALSILPASPALTHSVNPALNNPTVTYLLSINDNGSGVYQAGHFAIYVTDSTSDGNTGLASYNLSLANGTTINNFSPRGLYDNGTSTTTDDQIGFTLLRSGANTSPITGSQDTIDYPNGVVLVYGFGQTAGNLANNEPGGSTGSDGNPTQASYKAVLEIAKGTFSGLAPSFSNQANDTANDFVNNSGASTEPTSLAFSTNTLSTPEPGSLSLLGIGAMGMLARRKRRRGSV
jgi:hypothetical protein